MGSSEMVPFGTMLDSGQLVEIGCLECDVHLYVEPASLRDRVPIDMPIHLIRDVIRCPKCGARNGWQASPVWARPDARPPKMGAAAVSE